jgi:hypothetical protein
VYHAVPCRHVHGGRSSTSSQSDVRWEERWDIFSTFPGSSSTCGMLHTGSGSGRFQAWVGGDSSLLFLSSCPPSDAAAAQAAPAAVTGH